MRLETEELIYRYRVWQAYPGSVVVHWFHRIQRLRFPAPGRYVIKLQFDDSELAERYIDVMRN